MKKLTIYLLTALLFSGCSFDTPPNEWQYKSVNAFDSYTKNFLSSNDNLAKNDLQRAVKHAKNSSDLTHLGSIYLGECALNISVGITDKCEKYQDIKDLINSQTLNAYYDFLTLNIKEKQISQLPKIYRDLVWHVKNEEFTKINNDIVKMDRPTSQLLSTSLLKDKVDNNTIERVIEVASFNGYKKAVIFWLNELKNRTNDKKKITKLNKKISILKDFTNE
ncbi:MAG: hypothetical protein U9Q29_01950 [Campylobacterota bacterium]|nr:hypothetical protein [Campylobacterota bacterium]